MMTSQSMGKLETRNQKLEIGKEKGVLSEGEAAARTGRWDKLPLNGFLLTFALARKED